MMKKLTVIFYEVAVLILVQFFSLLMIKMIMMMTRLVGNILHEMVNVRQRSRIQSKGKLGSLCVIKSVFSRKSVCVCVLLRDVNGRNTNIGLKDGGDST